VLSIWLDGFELIFTNFTGVKTFAPHIYLFGEGVRLPEIEESLNKEPWTKKIPFKSPPKIQALTLDDMPKITDATGLVLSNEWLALAALSYIYEEVT
jgi:hypothetical protein